MGVQHKADVIKIDEVEISVCSLAFPSVPCSKTAQAAVFSCLGPLVARRPCLSLAFCWGH